MLQRDCQLHYMPDKCVHTVHHKLIAFALPFRRRPRARGRARAAAVDEPEVELLSTTSERCQRRGLVYRILKFKRKLQCPQFLDRYWEQQPSYAKLQT